MIVAAALLFYVVVVFVAGPALLHKLTADGTAPRLAIAAWLTAIVSVIGSFTAAMGLLIIEAAGHWGKPDELLASCIERLQALLLGHGGVIAQILANVIVAAALSTMFWTSVRIVGSLRRMREQTFAHADAVRLVGRPAQDGVIVVQADEPAAYCVAGRPPAIVVTTAVLATLDARQLAAVLAHERAHLDGRHAHVVAALRSLTAFLPHVALFSLGAARVTALLEMCADDVAARRHGRQPLLAGLLALTGANPSHALGAASVAVLTRAQRLTNTQGALTRMRAYVTLAGAVGALAAVPLGVGALGCTGVLLCFA